MSGRSYLKEKIMLCGESDGITFKRTFKIVKKISEGASVICYEAYHGNSGHGILKEFYPQEAFGVGRDKNGQIVHSTEFKDAYKRFESAMAEYVEPYEMLLTAKRNDISRELATFIPPFEIYHGCNDDGVPAGTVYIWTPEPKLFTFDKICEEIHKHPTKKPEHKLVTVLSAMDTLAKCICLLHSSDMLHRDIKPSNFGFIKRGDDTLTQTLSMFDINTICSVYGDLDSVVGSLGYMEPEAGYEIATNQTDIYAIGATLFHAIIVCDETSENGYVYQKDFFRQIQDLVDNSKLIQASEANSHPRLRNILAKILRKCLCERAHRYENCEELIEDLDIALYYALPSEIAQKHKSGATWILADVEKSFDNKVETNSTIAIQQLLFEHPLYKYAEDSVHDINILVVGFGNYGQKFLDAVLQVGQMRNKRLNVMVISDDVTDKQIYISERPALAQFFNIDGSIADSETSYGSVSFSVASLERKNLAANAEILQNLTLEHYESSPLHYIFIALGDDLLNRSAANACLEVVDVLGRKCTISYVCEGTASDEHSDSLTPVLVRGEISETPFYNEIERMAFNTHLIWEKNLNIDVRKVKAEFKKKYNYNSCVSSVLSLKYKLFSVGIDLDQLTYGQAAQMFTLMLSDKKNRGIKNELIWIEHRRWVAEKVCLGWQGIADLNTCVFGVTKDEKRKRHVCILRSRPDQKLAAEYKVNGSYDKWDSASDSEIALLDDLDQMSVRLHRFYRQKANEIRTENLLAGHSIAVIREQITGNKNATAAFQEWYSCLKDIWNGDSGKVRLYKGLKETFLRSAETLPFERKRAIAEQVKSFETLYYPIMSSIEYRDWKQDDVAMIDNIPFVLTYSENAYMVVPYVIGDNTAVFGNVAAPTIVNPARVLYLYMIENKYDVIALKDTLPYVVEYMQKKKLKSKIEIVLLYHRTIGSAVPSNLDEDIFTIGNKRILHPIKHIVYDSIEELPTAVSEYLDHRSKGKSLFAMEKNISRLSSMLQVSGVYNGFANYQFDSQNAKFYSLFGCEAFGYIKKAAYISVSDMVSFKLSSSESSNQPEFFLEYKDLWKKYAEKSSTWKALCDALSEHSVKHDVIATFKKLPPRKKLSVAEEYRYTLPFECCNNAMKVMNYLKSHGVLEANSVVSGYTTNSCEIRIVDKCGYKKEYDRLFANVYALMAENAISINLNTRTHDITVLFNNLIVSGVQLIGSRNIELQALLEYFNQEGYIINLTKNVEGQFSFTYATLQIKELLTTAGKILEVYTYHKAKETGRFDDIVSSYELEWEDTPVKNEFDCILTKGFRTLFVECKARTDIEQEFYYKLAQLAEQFGINATAVLIADTQEKPFYDNAPVNALQRKRGNMMDVVTIWKSEEINNIGHTLLKIINGNYIMEES